MTFLDKLDFMMSKLKIGKSGLSERSGVPYTTIDSFYKKGFENTKMSTIKKIADALDVSLDYLMMDSITDESYGKTNGFLLHYPEMEHIKKYRTLDGHGKKVVDFVLDEEAARAAGERRRGGQREPTKDNVIYIPFQCSIQPASAGTGTYLGPEAFEIIHVRENDLTRRAAFGVPVQGDSMEPRCRNGDILIVEGAEEIEPGEIGIFTIDGEGYVKELGEGELISLNPEYDPIPINESIRCHGRVIGILEPEWIAEE